MNLRVIKKDIEFLISDFIDDCYLFMMILRGCVAHLLQVGHIRIDFSLVAVLDHIVVGRLPGDSDDARLDQRIGEGELRLVFLVVGHRLLVGHQRVEPGFDIEFLVAARWSAGS